MFLTNTGWTQNCATLVNLIYAFVKYIFIFLASVNKSNIFECILHIFISSSWIKHSFKKSHPRLLCDCLCIMDLLVLLLRKGHKWAWFQVRWSSENINFIRILSLLGKRGSAVALWLDECPCRKIQFFASSVLCPYPQTNMVWIIQCAFEPTVHLRSLSACYLRDITSQSRCTN